MADADPTIIDAHLLRLKTITEAIAHGQYNDIDALFELTVDDTATQNVRDLAEAFGAMVVQVEARELHLGQLIDDLTETKRQLEVARDKLEVENKGLQREVKQLKIVIDEKQRQEEVDSITDTDYFKTLKDRANDMRQRHRGKDSV